jgi:plastocyanin
MRFNPPRLLLAWSAITFATVGFAAGNLAVSATDKDSAPIADLIVWLTPLDAPMPALPPAGSIIATVEQINEEFDPYTIAVRSGTLVKFPNLDDVQHHVYSLSRPSKFDIPLYGGNKSESVIMDQAGVVPVGCNIHDWMLSYIVVVESPWFGQSTATGRIALAEVPAGRYTLSAWHPRLRKAHEQEVSVGPTDTSAVTIELSLRADRRIRRAPTAGGKGY